MVAPREFELTSEYNSSKLENVHNSSIHENVDLKPLTEPKFSYLFIFCGKLFKSSHRPFLNPFFQDTCEEKIKLNYLPYSDFPGKELHKLKFSNPNIFATQCRRP